MKNDSEERTLIGSGDGARRDAVYQSRFWIAVVIAFGVSVVLVVLLARGTPAAVVSPCTTDTCVRAPAIANTAMVSTTHNEATRIGLDILRKGGNAFDAAAAVQWALAVVQPQSCGLGGGALIVGYKPPATTDAERARRAAQAHLVHTFPDGGVAFTIDGREEAPARFSPNAFCKNVTCQTDPDCDCSEGAWPHGDKRIGGHSAGVPGVFAAYERLVADHGTMTFGDTMTSSIQMARDGFSVYPSFRNAIIRNKATLQYFQASRELYLINGGEAPELGTKFKNPGIASTLELLAAHGPPIFYEGTLGDEFVAAGKAAVNPVTGLASVMEKSDLTGYKAVYRQPIQFTYRNYTLFGFGPPSSGGITMGHMMNMLENFDMSSLVPGSPEWYTRLIDIQDIAFSDRNKYAADGDWVDVPVAGFLNKAYASQRLNQFVKPVHSARAAAGGAIPTGVPPTAEGIAQLFATPPEGNQHGTSHYVIIDQWGNIASCTTTVEDSLGNNVVIPGRGFTQNNELTDFTNTGNDLVTGLPYANRPEGGKRLRRSALGSDNATMGGKRPMSSMTPTIIFHQNAGGSPIPFMGVGAPGGSNIIAATMYGALGVIDGDLCITDAIDMPRAISMNLPTKLEPRLFNNTKVLAYLESHGYEHIERAAADTYARVEGVVIRRPTDVRASLASSSSSSPRTVTTKHLEGGADLRESVATAAGY